MRIVILGGMAAGCKAGARLKRLNPDYEVIILEKNSFVSYGTCGMPYYASGDIDAFNDLAKTSWGALRDPNFFLMAKDIDVRINSEVISVDFGNKSVLVLNLITNEQYSLGFDKLLIATGAHPAKPKLLCDESDSISNFHNPLDAKKFRELAQKGKLGSIAIIGGGYIGCELAEAAVSLWGIETSIIERESSLLPNFVDNKIANLLHKVYEENGISLLLDCSVNHIKQSGQDIELVLSSGQELSADHVFICTGVEPSTEIFANSELLLDAKGRIIVDDCMRTNIEYVWAAGDCVTVKNIVTAQSDFLPLGSLANRQGRIAADSMGGKNSKFTGSCGTISMTVFGHTVACSGISSKKANSISLDFGNVSGTWTDRPDFQPGHELIYANMIFEKSSRRLLGLQAFGKSAAVRYTDVFSVYLSKGGTIDDLMDFEHCYNPPQSSPINPLNNLAYIADAELNGIKQIDFTKLSECDFQIVDLRDESEIEESPFQESTLKINYMELRTEYTKLVKDKPIVLICQKGPRSYESAVFLKHMGYKVYYLGGGVHLADGVLDLGDE